MSKGKANDDLIFLSYFIGREYSKIFELLLGAEDVGKRSRENSTYIIDKGTELGRLVESYQQLEENIQRKLLRYMEALRELQGESR